MVENLPTTPFISVVIPVRNRSDLLRDCLHGLTKQDFCLDQLEIVVCDDGSTELLFSVVDEFRSSLPNLQLIQQSPQGPAAARNLGIRHSTGEIIIFLDSDVLPDRNLIRSLSASLASHPHWQGAEARIDAIGGENNPLWDAPVCDNGGHYHTAAIAYRRHALVNVGGLDESFPLAACEDLELAVRILDLGPIGFVPQAIVQHPRRRRSFAQRWKARKYWKYVAILAKRYGFVGWPNSKTSTPRIRTAFSAVLTLPLGRIRQAIGWIFRSPLVGAAALAYSIFDILCGIAALPSILIDRSPSRKDYLELEAARD